MSAGITRAYKSVLVEVSQDYAYSPNSIDNSRTYTHIIKADSADIPSNKRAIVTMTSEEQEISSAIILSSFGGGQSYESLFALTQEALYICAGASVICLEIPSLELRWQREVADGQAFEVFDIQEGIIVHGELAVTRLDYDGAMEWQRWGPDIFVTEKGKDDFQIIGDRVRAKCWDGTTLTWDLNGNKI